MTDVVVTLPDSLRVELKSPAGPLYTDPERLLADTTEPLVTVGDVVTHHVLGVGPVPKVALVDERTERSAVDPAVRERIEGSSFAHECTVANPPAGLSAELLETLPRLFGRDGTTLVAVDGEEDLATLPAVLVAPPGASVVYGQPGEGMVLVPADESHSNRMRDLLARMDGDPDRLFELLG